MVGLTNGTARAFLAAALVLGIAAPEAAGARWFDWGRHRDLPRNETPTVEAGEKSAGEARSARPAAPAPTVAPRRAARAATAIPGGMSDETISVPDDKGAVPVHVLSVDLGSGRFSPRIVMADPVFSGGRSVTDIVARQGAVAGINGAFFDMRAKAPVGLLMINKKPVQAPLVIKSRTTLGVLPDGAVIMGKPKFRRRIRPENEFFSMIDGINRRVLMAEIILFTREYGPKAAIPEGGAAFALGEDAVVTSVSRAKEAAIPETGALLVVASGHMQRFSKTKVGDHVLLTQTLMYPFDSVVDAFGSVIALVSEGRVSYDQKIEEVSSQLLGRAPRSAIGMTKDGVLKMVVAEGRGQGFAGLTLPRLAEVMLSLGCADAVALDGGGSSALVLGGRLLNRPSDGSERRVASAFVILPRP